MMSSYRAGVAARQGVAGSLAARAPPAGTQLAVQLNTLEGGPEHTSGRMPAGVRASTYPTYLGETDGQVHDQFR